MVPSIPSGETVGVPSIQSRLYLSTYFLQAANRLKVQSDRAEQPFRGNPAPIRGNPAEEIQAALFEHNACVLGAVFSAVAFLEATVVCVLSSV